VTVGKLHRLESALQSAFHRSFKFVTSIVSFGGIRSLDAHRLAAGAVHAVSATTHPIASAAGERVRVLLVPGHHLHSPMDLVHRVDRVGAE